MAVFVPENGNSRVFRLDLMRLPRERYCAKKTALPYETAFRYFIAFFFQFDKNVTHSLNEKKKLFLYCENRSEDLSRTTTFEANGSGKATSNRFVDRTSKREFGGKMFNSLFSSFHANTSSREFSGECMHRLAIHCKVNWHSK